VRLSDPDRELVLKSITQANEESEPGALKIYRLSEPVASFHKEDVKHCWYDKACFEEVAEKPDGIRQESLGDDMEWLRSGGV
jgi:hypothetical protein